jgi:hypothetical protein
MPMSIREWRRLDVHNGLLLSALWDAAFDQGLVSFADNGSVLASSQLSETARKALDLDHVPLLAVLRDASRASTPTMTTLPLAAQPITEVGDPFQGRLTRNLGSSCRRSHPDIHCQNLRVAMASCLKADV